MEIVSFVGSLVTFLPQVSMFGGAMLLPTDDYAKNALSVLRLWQQSRAEQIDLWPFPSSNYE